MNKLSQKNRTRRVVSMKSGFLHRLLDRADKIDKDSIVDYMKQVAFERDLLVLIFDSMSEGILFIDEEETVVYVNQSARDMMVLGDGSTTPDLSLERLLGNSRLYAYWEKSSQQSASEGYTDFSLKTQSETRFLKLKTVPLEHGEKRYGTLLLCLDETGKRQQEKKLREAEKLAALTTLSAGVSHEIRNPLNSLSIHLQLLQRHLKKQNVHDEEIDDFLQIFSSEIARLNDVIEKFLSAVRPTKPQTRIVRFYPLVMDTLNLMEPEFRSQSIQVSVHEEGEWPYIEADDSQIKQALINILRNAIESFPEGDSDSAKTIQIHMIHEIDHVDLVISDTGGGMDESELKNLFEPYFTTKPKGTGLGMMLVERIFREHKGGVTAHSVPGEGTQIRMRLPIVPEGPRLLEHEKATAHAE